MALPENIKAYFKHPLAGHILFWIGVYLFYITSNADYFETTEELLVTYCFKVGNQFIGAMVLIYGLIPLLTKKKQYVLFVVGLLALLLLLHMLYTAARMGFLEIHYQRCYTNYFATHGHLTYWERIMDWRVVLLRTPGFFLQPAFFLLAFGYYRKQQNLLRINEQKKTAELKALKNQLNPHFLFNTLNNLYALSLEKDDRAPEVIEKLSDILDYMLHGCNDTYVPLYNEVKLMEDYIALEELRFGKRMEIDFHQAYTGEIRIAPLLLLTFVENACKHGVSQELKKAWIKISLQTQGEEIHFSIANSKPKGSQKGDSGIGLKNVQQQLELLYPNGHVLDIKETEDIYQVDQKLKAL